MRGRGGSALPPLPTHSRSSPFRAPQLFWNLHSGFNRKLGPEGEREEWNGEGMRALPPNPSPDGPSNHFLFGLISRQVGGKGGRGCARFPQPVSRRTITNPRLLPVAKSLHGC